MISNRSLITTKLELQNEGGKQSKVGKVQRKEVSEYTPSL